MIGKGALTSPSQETLPAPTAPGPSGRTGTRKLKAGPVPPVAPGASLSSALCPDSAPASARRACGRAGVICWGASKLRNPEQRKGAGRRTARAGGGGAFWAPGAVGSGRCASGRQRGPRFSPSRRRLCGSRLREPAGPGCSCRPAPAQPLSGLCSGPSSGPPRRAPAPQCPTRPRSWKSAGCGYCGAPQPPCASGSWAGPRGVSTHRLRQVKAAGAGEGWREVEDLRRHCRRSEGDTPSSPELLGQGSVPGKDQTHALAKKGGEKNKEGRRHRRCMSADWRPRAPSALP